MNKKAIVALAQEISKQIENELSKLPYSANAIDELHANENAHSRILRMLLQYSGGHEWPIYRSFLELVNNRSSSFYLQCNNPIFLNEKDRIDLLINDCVSENKYAIIVENKVCNAEDQDEQIERYIKKQEDAGIKTKDIVVVYLTSDGIKKISANSLTDTAKEKLGYKGDEEKGRFVELNYKDDILPWIEKNVLPNIAITEELLISSVRLYIDYLKGMFGLRNDESIIHRQIQNKMEDTLNIATIQDGFQLLDNINTLQYEVGEIVRNKATALLEDHLKIPLEIFLKKYDGAIADIGYYSDNRFYCRIGFEKWKKLIIQITHEWNIGIYGICHKDLNNNPLSDKEVSVLRRLFPETRQSDWWPTYNRLNMLDDTAGSVEIWKSIEAGRFCLLFEEWIKGVLDKTKDLDL